MSACASSSPVISPAHRVSSMVFAVAFELFCAFSAILLAISCTTLGAIAGAMGGLKTGSGFLHGTIVGSLIGCIISTEISSFLYALRNPNDSSTIGFFVPLIKTTSKILKERLAQHSSTSFQDSGEIQVDDAQLTLNQVQHTRSSKSSSREPTDKIRQIRLASRNIVKTLWNGASCTICLQDFQVGEKVCLLRGCRHTFHDLCIGKWLIGHTSCPLCRADL